MYRDGPTQAISFRAMVSLIKDLDIIAREEMRNRSQVILLFVQAGVDAWKRKHEREHDVRD